MNSLARRDVSPAGTVGNFVRTVEAFRREKKHIIEKQSVSQSVPLLAAGTKDRAIEDVATAQWSRDRRRYLEQEGSDDSEELVADDKDLEDGDGHLIAPFWHDSRSFLSPRQQYCKARQQDEAIHETGERNAFDRVLQELRDVDATKSKSVERFTPAGAETFSALAQRFYEQMFPPVQVSSRNEAYALARALDGLVTSLPHASLITNAYGGKLGYSGEMLAGKSSSDSAPHQFFQLGLEIDRPQTTEKQPETQMEESPPPPSRGSTASRASSDSIGDRPQIAAEVFKSVSAVPLQFPVRLVPQAPLGHTSASDLAVARATILHDPAFLDAQQEIILVLMLGWMEGIRQVYNQTHERGIVMEKIRSCFTEILFNTLEAARTYKKDYEDLKEMKLDRAVIRLQHQLAEKQIKLDAALIDSELKEETIEAKDEEIAILRDRIQQLQANITHLEVKEQLRSEIIKDDLLAANRRKHAEEERGKGDGRMGIGGGVYPSQYTPSQVERFKSRRRRYRVDITGKIAVGDTNETAAAVKWAEAQHALDMRARRLREGGRRPSLQQLGYTYEDTNTDDSEPLEEDELVVSRDAHVQVTSVEDEGSAEALFRGLQRFLSEMDTLVQTTDKISHQIYGTADIHDPSPTLRPAVRRLEGLSEDLFDYNTRMQRDADVQEAKLPFELAGVVPSSGTISAALAAQPTGTFAETNRGRSRGCYIVPQQTHSEIILSANRSLAELTLRMKAISDNPNFQQGIELRPPKHSQELCKLCKRVEPDPALLQAFNRFEALRTELRSTSMLADRLQRELANTHKQLEFEQNISSMRQDELESIRRQLAVLDEAFPTSAPPDGEAAMSTSKMNSVARLFEGKLAGMVAARLSGRGVEVQTDITGGASLNGSIMGGGSMRAGSARATKGGASASTPLSRSGYAVTTTPQTAPRSLIAPSRMAQSLDRDGPLGSSIMERRSSKTGAQPSGRRNTSIATPQVPIPSPIKPRPPSSSRFSFATAAPSNTTTISATTAATQAFASVNRKKSSVQEASPLSIFPPNSTPQAYPHLLLTTEAAQQGQGSPSPMGTNESPQSPILSEGRPGAMLASAASEPPPVPKSSMTLHDRIQMFKSEAIAASAARFGYQGGLTSDGIPRAPASVIKLIHSIYRTKMINDGSALAQYSIVLATMPETGVPPPLKAFPEHVVQQLQHMFGTRKLVQQHTRNLLGAIGEYSHIDSRVRLFGAFVTEAVPIQVCHWVLRVASAMDMIGGRYDAGFRAAGDEARRPCAVPLDMALQACCLVFLAPHRHATQPDAPANRATTINPAVSTVTANRFALTDAAASELLRAQQVRHQCLAVANVACHMAVPSIKYGRRPQSAWNYLGAVQPILDEVGPQVLGPSGSLHLPAEAPWSFEVPRAEFLSAVATFMSETLFVPAPPAEVFAIDVDTEPATSVQQLVPSKDAVEPRISIEAGMHTAPEPHVGARQRLSFAQAGKLTQIANLFIRRDTSPKDKE